MLQHLRERERERDGLLSGGLVEGQEGEEDSGARHRMQAPKRKTRPRGNNFFTAKNFKIFGCACCTLATAATRGDTHRALNDSSLLPPLSSLTLTSLLPRSQIAPPSLPLSRGRHASAC